MKIIKLIRHAIGAVLLFLSMVSFAENSVNSNPVSLLRGVADKMVVQLSANQSKLKTNPDVVRKIVEEVLIPYVDTTRMAGMVVGRNNWYSVSADERHQFVEEFESVVIATYSDALASFDDDKVVVYPLRQSADGEKYVQVNSAIIRKSGQKIGINYNLISSGSSWKIYDFSIEGISIVQNYRAQFANTLANGGMKKLIAQLENYNEKR